MFVAARQIAPKVLALVGGAIDEGVDGLEPQGPQATLVAGLEPSGDLFGGPSFRKTIADERRCGAVPAIRWISLVEAPRRWRRSSGRPRS